MLRCVVLVGAEPVGEGSARLNPGLEMKPVQSSFGGSFHGKEYSILLHHLECLNFEE